MNRMSLLVLRQLLKKKPQSRARIFRFIICECGELMRFNKGLGFFHCGCGVQFWLPKKAKVVDSFGRLN